MLENICYVHHRHGRYGGCEAVIGTMVKRDGFYDGIGKSPQGEEVAADFSVGGSQELSFRFDQRDVFRFRHFLDMHIFVWQICCENKLSYVVEYPRHERIVDRGLILDLMLHDCFSYAAYPQAMSPDFVDVES